MIGIILTSAPLSLLKCKYSLQYDVYDVLLGNVVKCLKMYFPVERH
jgi:hypothetical protein